MKRDILDDFHDFLITEGNKISYFMEPMRAMVGPNGNIQQDMYIKGIIPGVGVVHGAAIQVKHGYFHAVVNENTQFFLFYIMTVGDGLLEKFLKNKAKNKKT